MKILLVDDEKELCDELGGFIASLHHDITKAYNGQEALELIRKLSFDLILSDVTMPLMSGIDLAKALKEQDILTDIVLISGRDDIIQSINAIDLGIFDFLTKPVEVEKLAGVVRRVGEKIAKKNKPPENFEISDRKLVHIEKFVFQEDYSYYQRNMGKIGLFSHRIAAIFSKLKKLQEFPEIPVLIEGETGTGKEIIAKYIHYENMVMEGPFIGVNCSTFPRDLFDAELFGYEKGAFTGADTKGREGKIKLAENGTLFLDEITEIPLDMQVKLLRVLQEREYYKIGGNQKFPVNARIICATNRNIRKMVEKGLFREDLYYRLNICQVNIPPLRERREEIAPLTIFFIHEFNNQLKKKIESIETEALKFFENYSWPGNVRELKNILNKVILFHEGKKLSLKDFQGMLNESGDKKMKLDFKNLEIPDEPFELDQLIDTIVKKTLDKFKGNKTKTAEFLGLSRIQLYRRFK